MAHVVVMPKQGNTVESCVLVSWKVAEGATVATDDVVCEVETDKATFEVAAGAAGVLLKQLCAAGDDVPVLQPIAVVGQKGEDWRAAVEGGAAPGPTAAPAAAAAPRAQQPSRQASAAPSAAPAGMVQRGLSPRARRLAREQGLSTAGLAGTGPRGRVIERDVRAALESRRPPAVAGATGGYAETPLKSVRKIIADRMRASLSTTAQLTLHASAPAARMVELRSRFKASDPALGLSEITIGDLVAYAVLRVVPRFPALNSHLVGGTIRTFERVHLGCAVDTPRGLLVPVVRDADRLSLAALSAESKRLAAACQDGSVKPDELTGSTFTVSNLGAFGIESFTPVLNAPEVAILGVCAIVARPVPAKDGSIAVEQRMGLSLTVDHQVIDGAPAARILKAFCEAIGDVDLLWTR